MPVKTTCSICGKELSIYLGEEVKHEIDIADPLERVCTECTLAVEKKRKGGGISVKINEKMTFKLITGKANKLTTYFYFWYFEPEEQNHGCDNCDACFIGFGFLFNKYMRRIFFFGHEFKWTYNTYTKRWE